MAKKNELPPLEPREFRSPDEIDGAISKLQRRIREIERIDCQKAVTNHTAEIGVAESNLHDTVRDVFGLNSPEYREHQHTGMWEGGLHMKMTDYEIIRGHEAGRKKVIGILNGLIGRLNEKREDMQVGGAAPPTTYFDKLKLHPRIRDVARDRFMGGQPWDAVFAASKALVNFVKERSDSDLDGAQLMLTVFSKNNPILAFNDLADKTKQDEQEGMMHLYVGAVLAIRNQGGHTFPEGSDQRAIEYLSLLSTLAYRTQEAEKRR